MKQLHFLLLVCCSMIFTNCDKESKNENKEYQLKGYIVGYDPCTINYIKGCGYIIISSDLRDTLLTYNLSGNNYNVLNAPIVFDSDTLYRIPKVHFNKDIPFFPVSLRFSYPIRITYRFASEHERTYNLCSTDVLSLSFKEVITKSATKQF